MEKKPFFSIIVPIYNVENYLTDCLDSILAQTYADFELLLINDGSTDTSGEIAEQYRERERRISLIHQQNAGQSVARNKGLQLARGEYIVFVDSDDRLQKDALAYYAKYLKDKNIDIIYTEFSMISDEGKELGRQKFWFDMDRFGGSIQSGEILLHSLYQKKSPLFTYAWQGAVKKSFLDENHLRFYEGIYSEDILFGLSCFSCAKNVFISPKYFYEYRQSLISSTRGTFDNKKNIKHIKSYLIVIEEIYKLAQTNPFGVSQEVIYFYLRCIRTLLKRISRLLRQIPYSQKKVSILQEIKPYIPYASFKIKLSLYAMCFFMRFSKKD